MRSPRRPILAAFAVFFCAAFLSSGTFACDVPVFRYALERWVPDLFDVVVIHNEPLSPEEQNILSRLEEASADGTTWDAFRVAVLDAGSGGGDRGHDGLRSRGIDPSDLPVMALYAPEERRLEEPVWQGKLTAENVAALIDSPARRELARRLVEGDSGVWMFVGCGDPARDEAAAGRLDENLRNLEEAMQISADPEANEGRYDPGLTGTPVEIRFSRLSVSREDPAESVLVAMLMSVEPDLEQYAEYPMAFPVFGRGRALYALVGKGINEENTKAACDFLAGPCSCEAKALNPGADLLVNTDWDRMLDEAGEEPMVSIPQPLVSLASLAEASGEVQAGSGQTGGAGEAGNPSAPFEKPDNDAAVASSASAGGEAASSSPAAESTSSLQSPGESVSGERPSGGDPTRNAVQGGLAEEPDGENALLRNMLLALGIVLIGILIWSVQAGRRFSKDVS